MLHLNCTALSQSESSNFFMCIIIVVTIFLFIINIQFISYHFRGLAVGIYATNSPEACQYVAENCKANVLVVENNAQLQKILQVGIDMIELDESWSSRMKLRNLICNPYPMSKNWEFCKLGSVHLPPRVDIRVQNSWIMRFKLLCTGVTVLYSSLKVQCG